MFSSIMQEVLYILVYVVEIQWSMDVQWTCFEEDCVSFSLWLHYIKSYKQLDLTFWDLRIDFFFWQHLIFVFSKLFVFFIIHLKNNKLWWLFCYALVRLKSGRRITVFDVGWNVAFAILFHVLMFFLLFWKKL